MATSATRFRIAIWSFAIILVVQALWLLFAEFARPRLPYFPTRDISSKAAADSRASARLAAWLGLVRGDLWSNYAVSFTADVADESQSKDLKAQAIKDAYDAARHAARLSPHDARVWLILAAAVAQLDGSKNAVIGPLKMSYYTSASEAVLMPLRIRIATRSDAIEDEEVRELATQDIGFIVGHRPDMRSDVVTAYRYASSSGRRFIEATLNKLDPTLLHTARGTP